MQTYNCSIFMCFLYYMLFSARWETTKESQKMTGTINCSPNVLVQWQLLFKQSPVIILSTFGRHQTTSTSNTWQVTAIDIFYIVPYPAVVSFSLNRLYKCRNYHWIILFKCPTLMVYQLHEHFICSINFNQKLNIPEFLWVACVYVEYSMNKNSSSS